MNDMVNVLCISMLFGSIIPLSQSLIKTILAYKKHKELKKNLEKSNKYTNEKLEEILTIQKEIIEIMDNMDNSNNEQNVTLEKERKELEKNYLKLKQVTGKKYKY